MAVTDIFSSEENISEHTIRNLKDKLKWKLICRYSKLSEKFMEGMSDYVEFEQIAKFQTLSEYIIDKYEVHFD